MCRCFFRVAAWALVLSACSTTGNRVAPRPSGGLVKSGNTASASSPLTNPWSRSSKNGGFYQDDGPAIDIPPNLDTIANAQPVAEPLSRLANRPYNVFGIDYIPQTDIITPYRQRGVASWYGKKFHGQKTSSGETYDMFGMTAAHPTLPIPCYVKVTNPANGRSVIVRVNDRGPFLHGRLIDLSYTAAYKLGYVNQGSADVEVEKFTPELMAAFKSTDFRGVTTPMASTPTATLPDDPIAAFAQAPSSNINPARIQVANVHVLPVIEKNSLPSPLVAENKNDIDNKTHLPGAAVTENKGVFLQLAAFGNRDNAENMLRKLSDEPDLQATPLLILPAKSLFKVVTGPYTDRTQAKLAAQKLQGLLTLEPLVLQP